MIDTKSFVILIAVTFGFLFLGYIVFTNHNGKCRGLGGVPVQSYGTNCWKDGGYIDVYKK